MSHSEIASTPATSPTPPRRRGIVHRATGAAIAFLLLAGGLVTGGLVTAGGAAAAIQGTITVSRTTNLVTHQIVTVTGSGWGPGAAVGWCEGVPTPPPNPPDQQYCNANAIVLGTADADGNFSGKLQMLRFIYVAPNAHRVDCADPTSTCVVGAGDQSDVAGTGIAQVVKFATVPRTIFPGAGSVVEGNAGTKVVKVPVRLSQAQTKPATVQWKTQYVQGPSPGLQAVPFPGPGIPADYTPASGTVTFAAGQTLKTVSITVNGDTVVEPDEYILVAFSHPVNAVMGGFWGLGSAKIVNDD